MLFPRACNFETRPSPRSKIGMNAGHGKKYGLTGVNRTVDARLIHAKYTENIRSAHDKQIVFCCSPPFPSD